METGMVGCHVYPSRCMTCGGSAVHVCSICWLLACGRRTGRKVFVSNLRCKDGRRRIPKLTITDSAGQRFLTLTKRDFEQLMSWKPQINQEPRSLSHQYPAARVIEVHTSGVGQIREEADLIGIDLARSVTAGKR